MARPLTNAQIAEEAALLRDLLRAARPDAKFVPVRDRSLPAGPAAFWNALGWSSFMEDCGLIRPDYDTGDARLRAVLCGWRNQGMSTLRRSDLPPRVRLVVEDGQGVGMLVADETRDVVDPPLLAVLADQSVVKREKGTYLKTVCAQLLRALEPRAKVWVNAKPRRLITGTRLLPNLAPQLRRTRDGFLAHRTPGGGADLEVPSLATFFAWLRRTEFERVQVDQLNVMAADFDETYARMRRRKTLPTGSSEVLVLGVLDGSEVLLGRAENGYATVSSPLPSEELYQKVHRLEVAPSFPLARTVDAFELPYAKAQPTRRQLEACATRWRDVLSDLGVAGRPKALRGKRWPVAVRGLLNALRVPELTGVIGLEGKAAKPHLLAASKAYPPASRWLVLAAQEGSVDRWRVALVDPGAGADPPVVVLQDRKPLFVGAPRASTFLMRFAAMRLLEPREAEVTAHPTLIPWEGSHPMGRIDPEFMQLAEGVYRLGSHLAIRDAHCWVRFLDTLEDEELQAAFAPWRFSVLRPTGKKVLTPARVEKLGLRPYRFRNRNGQRCPAGYGIVEGVPVWVLSFGGRTHVYCDPAHTDRVTPHFRPHLTGLKAAKRYR
ncbi:MAG: hypothetical protein AAGE52_15905 [Myxococcota bacterium]